MPVKKQLMFFLAGEVELYNGNNIVRRGDEVLIQTFGSGMNGDEWRWLTVDACNLDQMINFLNGDDQSDKNGSSFLQVSARRDTSLLQRGNGASVRRRNSNPCCYVIREFILYQMGDKWILFNQNTKEEFVVPASLYEADSKP